MLGASAESLAAELGLPPGTEVVRSERTGEPLISMSVALQWMQQLVSAALHDRCTLACTLLEH